jgi:purine-binding chemotaxis protein CheW
MTTEDAGSPVGGSGTHLLFRRQTQLFAVLVADVTEMIEIPDTTRVPATASVVVGVINHHGDILPVLNTNALLDITNTTDHQQTTGKIGFIVGEGEGRMVVPIDATLGLVLLPPEGDHGEGLIQKTVVVEDQVIAVLDVDLLMNTVETAVTSAWQETAVSAEHEQFRDHKGE